MVSGIDLHTNIENRIEARQLRYSLEKYMLSSAFHPEVEANLAQIKEIFKEN